MVSSPRTACTTTPSAPVRTRVALRVSAMAASPALVHGLRERLDAHEIDLRRLDADGSARAEADAHRAGGHPQLALALDDDALRLHAQPRAGGERERGLGGVAAAAPAAHLLGGGGDDEAPVRRDGDALRL